MFNYSSDFLSTTSAQLPCAWQQCATTRVQVGSLDVKSSIQSDLKLEKAQVHFELGKVIESMIAVRRCRTSFFAPNLFGEPGWNILLDLALCRLKGRSVDVTSACIASAAPITTGLRALASLEAAGHVTRRADPDDRRRSYVELSDASFNQLIAYFISAVAACRAGNP